MCIILNDFSNVLLNPSNNVLEDHCNRNLWFSNGEQFSIKLAKKQ